MAKGVEDTAFYRYARLLALNDVGGDPGALRRARSTTSTRANAERARALPAQPAGHPDARHQALGRRARADRRAGRDGRRVRRARADVARRLPLADVRRRARRRSSSCFIFQTLLGAWPISEERLAAYLEKAMREAKRTRAGSSPTRRTRRPCRRFAPRAARRTATFLRDFEPFQRERGRGGRPRRARPAAAQADRARACPDIYQGDELLLPVAGRPGQPPPGRLGRARARRAGDDPPPEAAS